MDLLTTMLADVVLAQKHRQVFGEASPSPERRQRRMRHSRWMRRRGLPIA